MKSEIPVFGFPAGFLRVLFSDPKWRAKFERSKSGEERRKVVLTFMKLKGYETKTVEDVARAHAYAEWIVESLEGKGWVRPPLTFREAVGYEGEKKAIEILNNEGFSNIIWLNWLCYDIIAERDGELYLIDVKSSVSDKRKLPVHLNSLLRLIKTSEETKAKPLIVVIKPAKHRLVNPFVLLSGKKDQDVYINLYYTNKYGKDEAKSLILELKSLSNKIKVLLLEALKKGTLYKTGRKHFSTT
jgi:Holliday junction resolvase